ncbi:MAG: serine/threonine protein kinase [Deltaproteobacteria bacterium]|nr:serine/threonine protein kinase [Deltaproteobacteria bacterium]
MGIPRGTAIGSVVVDEPLDSGRSDLYRGRQRGLEREVVVRVLPRDRSGPRAEHFWREARFAARIAHPNVLQVFDCLARDGDVYLVREYVDGGSLREVLDRARETGSQRLRPQLAARITLELAVALEQLHLHSVVHTDLRPEHILVSRRGELKLDGLGGAREPGELPVDASELDPTYAAPELGRGARVDARADVHSLGALLEELVSGRRPGSAYAEVAHAPRRLQRLIRACRAPSPALRPDLAEVMHRLREAAGPVDARTQRAEVATWMWQVRVRSRARSLRPGEADDDPARPPAMQIRPPLRAGRHRALAAAGAMGLLALGAVLLGRVSAGPEPEPLPAVSAALPPPPQAATLTLAVYPWARVEIDGREPFYTPRAEPLELVPGPHEVVLDHPSHGEVRRVLELRAGERRTLRHTFIPRETPWSTE